MIQVFKTAADCTEALRSIDDRLKHGGILWSEFKTMTRAFNQCRGQVDLVRNNTSPSAQQDIGNTDFLRHCFVHYIKQRLICAESPNPDLQFKNLVDIHILGSWTSANYTSLLDTSPVQEQALNVAQAISYLGRDYLPALKTYLMDSQHLTADAMENILAGREKEILANRASGIEIILPVPPSEWHKAARQLVPAQ